MPFAVYQENHGDPLHAYTSNNNNNYPAHAQRMRRSVTDIYIYIYTHRESLVRNHEPCAKALGNNNYYMHVLPPLRIRVFLRTHCLPQLAFYVFALPWLATRSSLPFRRRHRYAKRGVAAVCRYSCLSTNLYVFVINQLF